MHIHGAWVPISRGQAMAWSRESLDQGSGISAQMAARLDHELVHAFAIMPRDRAGADVADFARSAQLGDADLLLGRFLRSLSATSDSFLVVDDDLARRGDPGLDDVSYIDDRVIRWSDLQSAPDRLTRLLRTGASGYPLNAFVCGAQGGHAFRPPSGPLSESDVELLVSEARVVIHSIYDAESFLILVIDHELKELLETHTHAADSAPES